MTTPRWMVFVLLATSSATQLAQAQVKNEKARPRLNPPWQTLYERMKNSIGADPRIEVRSLIEQGSDYYLDVHAHALIAKDLAMLLKTKHEFGNVAVYVRVYNMFGVPIQPSAPASDDELFQACKRVFRLNDYYLKTILAPDAPPWLGKVIVVFKRAVIQYYNDDISDYYGNANEVAAAVFRKVLQMEWNTDGVALKLSVTTEKK